MFLPKRKIFLLLSLIITVYSTKSQNKQKSKQFFSTSFSNQSGTHYQEVNNNNTCIPDISVSSKFPDARLRFSKAIPVIFNSFKSVTLTGNIKKEKTNSKANLFCEAHGRFWATNTTEDQSWDSVNSWKSFSISIPLQEFSDTVFFGGYIEGEGRIYFSNIQLRFDDEQFEKITNDVPPEISTTAIQQLDKISLNLFSSGDKQESFTKIGSLLKNKRIIGLGESIHGSGEIQLLKIDLLKYLIQNEGFEAIAMETSMAEAELINEYIHSKGRDIKALMIENLHPIWRTNEIASMFEWLRNYNRTAAKPISFWGIDMQQSNEALKKLKGYKGDLLVRKCSDSIQQMLDNIPHPEELQPLQTTADSIAIMQKMSERILKKLKLANEDPAYLNYAILLNQYFTYQIGFGAALRDRFMADNLFRKIEYTGSKKIIVWAHDEHLCKFGVDGADDNDQFYLNKFGYYIKRKFGDSYYNFTFLSGFGTYTGFTYTPDNTLCFSSGNPLSTPPYGSFEFVLNQLKYSTSFINLSDVHSFPDNPLNKKQLLRSLGMKVTGSQFIPSLLYPLYDGVIYTKNSTSSDLLTPCKKNKN